MPMDKVTRVNIEIIGDRNYPIENIKLPSLLCEDLPILVDAAQALDPSITADDVIRAIYRIGTKKLRDSLASGYTIRLANLPGLVAPIKRREALLTGLIPDSNEAPGPITAGTTEPHD